MDTARKHVRRIQQLASQQIGRAEKTEVVTDDLHNVEQRTEHMIDALQHTKQKLAECLRSRSKEDNPDKRRKKLVEYHFAQSLLTDSKNLEDIVKDSLLSQILSVYGNGLLNVVEELVQSEFNIEKRIFEHLSKYSEESKSVVQQKEKMKKAVLDMDSARSRLLNAQNKGEKVDQLQDETDACWNKVESCKDNWALELYTLAGKEIDMANIFLILVKLQMDYYRTAYRTLEDLLPLIQIKIDQYPRRPVYGCHLADHLRYSNREIAVVLEVCCASLCELGLREEGLFRISGSTPKVRKLKASFDIDEIDLNDFENHPHSIAGALKLYLRELPDPLMTHNLYADWLRAVGLEETETRLKAIKDVVGKLPQSNLSNLRYLIKFLSKLCENQQYTKMNSQALAIVMAPNMLWSPNNDEGYGGNSALASLVDCLISNADYFFPGEIKYTSNRISTLINKTGGFVDSEFVVGQRSGGVTNNHRSRSPSSDISSFGQPSHDTKSIASLQPGRRPKPPAPPPPKASKETNVVHNHNQQQQYNNNAEFASQTSMNCSSNDDDPEYADVPDENEDVGVHEYSVVNKPAAVNKFPSSRSPDEETVGIIENLSTSIIRTPPPPVHPSAVAASSETSLTSTTSVASSSSSASKGHRKINSLDRPVKPPRYSVLENLNLTSAGSLERTSPEHSSRVKKLNITSDVHAPVATCVVDDVDKQRHHPSRPPLPSKENLEKHSTITSRHSINLKIANDAPSSAMTKSLPVYNSTQHGATNVEVLDDDDMGDLDIDYVENKGNDSPPQQGRQQKQAPTVAFRRNMFENNNNNENVQTSNGDVSSSKLTNRSSSTKKKSPLFFDEKSPTSADAPPRPKPPVPSKPSKPTAEYIDDNMTRL